MAHSPQHLAAAGLIADTFAPGSQGVPPASRMGVPEIMLDIAQRNPRSSERSQLEMLLLSLANSRVPQKRALFNSLRFGLMVTYYMAPGPTGHLPAWDAIGYPPPFGVHPDAPPRPGRPGGGGVPRRRGLRRLRAHRPDRDVRRRTPGLRRGTPDDVREEWAGLGAQQFAGEEYTRSLDVVCTRLGVNTDHDVAAPRDAVMQRGLEKLGWHVEAMPRNVLGCEMGVECGRCGLGCRIGAKQSVVKTWLQDASDAGARLVVGARAQRVIVTGGKAAGVEAVTASGHRIVVRSRAVVAAAGAIQTPALLRRSGLTNPNVGRHLRLHPVSVVWARYEEEVLPFTGAPQSRFSREYRDLDGRGYGVIYETAPTTPALAAGFIPWHGAEEHAGRMRQLPHLVPLVAITRDFDSGEVKVGRDGEPRVRYRLSQYDAAHL